ncbi:hypothetical protein ANRL2_04654 [Anaerolineae bacterium]|nr:hypothetical protein ANRL2_04654 [Anaerolineae bacterium]
MTITKETVAKLSPDERWELLRILMDYVRKEAEEHPVPKWQLDVVRERMEEHKKNPTEGRPWRDVMADMAKKTKKRR